MENQISIAELEAKAQDYCEIVNGFSSLLEDENQALRDYDTQKVGSLLDEKAKMVGAYRAIVGFFMKNQSQIQELNEELRGRMKEISARLDSLMKENDTLLKAKMQTSQNVMDAFVDIAKMVRDSNSTSYGSQGKYSQVDNTQSAIAINKTL